MQYEGVVGCLKENLDVLAENRAELSRSAGNDRENYMLDESESAQAASAKEAEEVDVDFVFDANTTLEDLDNGEQ